MSGPIVIRVSELSKYYRLGVIGRSTIKEDVQRWIDRLRGRPDPWEVEGYERGQAIWALRDASFEVERGEIVGIIGQNGSGKSTLLKILSKITAPTAGEARLRGRVGSLLEVGTGFHPELTGRENVYLNGAILGMRRSEIARKFDEIVEFSGVEPFVDTPVKRYSSGMRVRLAFAVAAHLEPEILLVDEVLAVGDVGFQKRCLGKMDEVARGGRTILFVSHDMSAISTLCPRTMFLDDGRIVMDGPTEQAIETYMESATGEGAHHGEFLYEAEGTDGETFELHAVRTLRAEGARRGDFRSSEPIVVEMEFTRHEHRPGLRIGFEVVTGKGTMAFRTLHNDREEILSPETLGERERIRAVIPPGLLNEGAYHIHPCVSTSEVGRWWLFRELPGPTVHVFFDVPNPQFRGSNRPGAVAPVIRWESAPPGDGDGG